jgi:hypothetical protein
MTDISDIYSNCIKLRQKLLPSDLSTLQNCIASWLKVSDSTKINFLKTDVKNDLVAEKLKLNGNLLYKNKNFVDAICSYSKAIKLASSEKLLADSFSNRSLNWLQLGMNYSIS